MFSSPRFLAYINKPSVYYLRRSMPLQTQKELLKQLDGQSRLSVVTQSNPIYKPAYEMIKQEQVNELLKYENSFMWSPQFTPKTFRRIFVIPTLMMLAFMLYLHYIVIPRNMMEHKRKFGIRYPGMEKMGFLDGWYDEYVKKDKLLVFEAYTLADMEKLYKQGMLAKSRDQTIAKIEKKKSKFIKGSKSFIVQQFKTT